MKPWSEALAKKWSLSILTRHSVPIACRESANFRRKSNGRRGIRTCDFHRVRMAPTHTRNPACLSGFPSMFKGYHARIGLDIASDSDEQGKLKAEERQESAPVRLFSAILALARRSRPVRRPPAPVLRCDRSAGRRPGSRFRPGAGRQTLRLVLDILEPVPSSDQVAATTPIPG